MKRIKDLNNYETHCGYCNTPIVYAPKGLLLENYTGLNGCKLYSDMTDLIEDQAGLFDANLLIKQKDFSKKWKKIVNMKGLYNEILESLEDIGVIQKEGNQYILL